jgi:aldose 1-epimerase
MQSVHVECDQFGVFTDGHPVQRYRLSSAGGFAVSIMEVGATVTAIEAPDRNGVLADVVLGYDDVGSYLGGDSYVGAVAGRYCNRIREARFALDGKIIELESNDGVHHLHGGVQGYHRQLWQSQVLGDDAVQFTRVSPAGEGGYPGTLTVTVTYQLLAPAALEITYRAVTDAPTVINLTQHSYFNLNGHDRGSIADHFLRVCAAAYLPTDEELLPLGRLSAVEGTPFDLRRQRRLGELLGDPNRQIQIARGFDHSWALEREPGQLTLAAKLSAPASGRSVQVFTDQPALQVYSGNFLHDGMRGKGAARYGRHSGLCLETQHFPDSPNHPQFPSTRLDPGREFHSVTRYVFAVNDSSPRRVSASAEVTGSAEP